MDEEGVRQVRVELGSASHVFPMLICYWLIIGITILQHKAIRFRSAGYLVHRYPEGRPCPSIAIAGYVPTILHLSCVGADTIY